MEENNKDLPNSQETETQSENKPYKIFSNKEEYEAEINSALKNKNKKIQELEYENKKYKYSSELKEFQPKIQELLINKLNLSVSDEEIKKQILELKEDFKDYLKPNENDTNISFISKKQEKDKKSFVDMVLETEMN